MFITLTVFFHWVALKAWKIEKSFTPVCIQYGVDLPKSILMLIKGTQESEIHFVEDMVEMEIEEINGW